MAIIVSHVASIIRGSIAGITYTANQYHPIIGRQRVAPAKFPTPNQTAFRGAFEQAALAWAMLSAANREAWNNYAQTVEYSKATGTYYTTGRNVFLGARSLINYFNIRDAAGLGLVDDAPTDPGRYAIAGIVVNDAGGPNPGTGFSLTINNFGSKPLHYGINLSIPFNPTRYAFKGPYDSSIALDGQIAASASTVVTINLGAGYDGKRVFWQVFGVTGKAAPSTEPHQFITDHFGSSLPQTLP